MKQKHFHTTYSAADIQNYLEEKLSASEMYALEKAALDDPILADAIEGMEIGSAYYQKDVQQLRERLFQKRKRSVVIAWSGAAVVVTALATYWILPLNQQKPVSKQEKLATTTIAPKHEEKITDTVATVSPDKIITSLHTDKPINHAPSTKKEIFQDSDSVPAQSSIPVEKEKRNSGNVTTVKAADIEKQPVSDPLLALEGRVPGLSIKQTYGRKDTILRRSNPSDSSLDEVAVKGYYTKRKEINKNVVDNPGDAQPVKGWKAYIRYLEKEQRKDPEDSLRKGTVIVRFYIEDNGALSDFHIDQSLSSFYDQEAIRLVKAGPGWKLKKGEREMVVLRVEFL